MSLLTMLQTEHRNLARLLDVAEGELLKIEDGGDCDRELLRAVAEYWREYPEQCHHPKEDLVVAKLRQRGILGDGMQEGVGAEHEELRRLNESLTRTLESVDGGQSGVLEKVLRQFVERNRDHMLHEERSFFPVMRRHLTEDDWEDLEFDLFDREDPVFKAAVETQYRILLDAILELEKKHAAEARQRLMWEQLPFGATEWLVDISTAEQFNNLAAAGHLPGDAHLRPEPGRGYVLERGGASIALIPTADEQCAAWCAYYFLLGADHD